MSTTEHAAAIADLIAEETACGQRVAVTAAAALLASTPFVRLIADSVEQTLSDLADDWPEDGMTRAEAQEFIVNTPIAVGRDEAANPQRDTAREGEGE